MAHCGGQAGRGRAAARLAGQTAALHPGASAPRDSHGWRPGTETAAGTAPPRRALPGLGGLRREPAIRSVAAGHTARAHGSQRKRRSTSERTMRPWLGRHAYHFDSSRSRLPARSHGHGRLTCWQNREGTPSRMMRSAIMCASQMWYLGRGAPQGSGRRGVGCGDRAERSRQGGRVRAGTTSGAAGPALVTASCKEQRRRVERVCSASAALKTSWQPRPPAACVQYRQLRHAPSLG